MTTLELTLTLPDELVAYLRREAQVHPVNRPRVQPLAICGLSFSKKCL